MRNLFGIVACLIVSFVCSAGSAQAWDASSERSFINHVDAVQLFSTTTGVRHNDFNLIGYHFTALKVGRVRLLGAGLDLALRSGGSDEWGDKVVRGEFLFTPGTVVEVRLTQDGTDAECDFTARYVINLSRPFGEPKSSGFVLGFSVGF